MAFQVDDIVKKTDGTQSYKVLEVLDGSKYKCCLEPNTCTNLKYTFKESDLELV